MTCEEPDYYLLGEGLVFAARFRLNRQVERCGEFFQRLTGAGIGDTVQVRLEFTHRGQATLVGNHVQAVI